MDSMTDIKIANGVEEISAKLNPINRLKIEYGINWYQPENPTSCNLRDVSEISPIKVTSCMKIPTNGTKPIIVNAR